MSYYCMNNGQKFQNDHKIVKLNYLTNAMKLSSSREATSRSAIKNCPNIL
jgi:hypothetical protein